MREFRIDAARYIWKWLKRVWRGAFEHYPKPGTFAVSLPICILGIAGLIYAGYKIGKQIYSWLEDLFNSTEDDDVRALINRSSCDELNRLSDDRVVNLINTLFDGPTADDDEQAILKLLGCLSCDRLRIIVGRVGVENLQSELQGDEDDELLYILGNCGIISFADLNDDATRIFVSRIDCDRINGLNIWQIKQLILNLFSGSTGDEDEAAILKIMRCLPCDRIQLLITMSGMSVEDFDDSVDGEEWDQLEAIFRSCGIPT